MDLRTARMREKRFKTRSEAGTLAMGERVAEMLLPAPKLIVLRGDLGAGKTTLVKGVAAALGAAEAEDVTSPTFTLVHEYVGRKVRLYHLDLYRLETERQPERKDGERRQNGQTLSGFEGSSGRIEPWHEAEHGRHTRVKAHRIPGLDGYAPSQTVDHFDVEGAVVRRERCLEAGEGDPQDERGECRAANQQR